MSPKQFKGDEPFVPIEIDSTSYIEPAMEHIFSIDGVEYFMPVSVPPAIALRVLEVIELQGEEAASSYVLHEVLGDEAHSALKNCTAVTSSQLKAIVEVVTTRAMGALESGN
jgi:hypothetical protein